MSEEGLSEDEWKEVEGILKRERIRGNQPPLVDFKTLDKNKVIVEMRKYLVSGVSPTETIRSIIETYKKGWTDADDAAFQMACRGEGKEVDGSDT